MLSIDYKHTVIGIFSPLTLLFFTVYTSCSVLTGYTVGTESDGSETVILGKVGWQVVGRLVG